VEGILITRLRYDQSKAEFERNINTMLYNVEAAYWNLYAAYYALYAREQGIRANYEVYRVNREQLIVGKSSPIEVAQAKGQFESFRVQRLTALGQVLERERQLRGLLGMPIEDGTRLVPTDEPVLAPIAPDWSAAVQTTLAQRPELTLARQDLKFRQLDLLQQKNQLRPDLRTFATYDVNGLGTRLDGRGNIEGGGDTSSEQNALRSMLSNRFHSWQLGLRMDVPIGFRDAQAAVRVSRLNLTRSYLVLKDQELKAERFLGQQYRQLFEANQQIVTQRAARLAAEEEIRTRAAKVIVGIGLYGDLNFFNAVERYSGALANEFQAIASYNTALAGFEFAKGTIMQYDNVTLADGPLPAHAQVRAVEHIRARHAALHVRDREAANVTGPATGLPSLQNLAEHPQPVPAIPAGPEMLPAPQPGAPGVPMVPMPTMPLNGPGGVPRGQVGLEYVPLPPGAVLPAQVPLMVSQ
jgi:outer membrane protein TolC